MCRRERAPRAPPLACDTSLTAASGEAGSAVRVSARLLDGASAVNVWAEHYGREAASGTLTPLDDLASRVIARLADGGGVLAHAQVTRNEKSRRGRWQRRQFVRSLQ